jgi:hypothetical protein
MARVGKLAPEHGLKIATLAVPFTPPDPQHDQSGRSGLGAQFGLLVRRLTGGV